jgi:thiol-disulfide isomerase/thioredoxin
MKVPGCRRVVLAVALAVPVAALLSGCSGGADPGSLQYVAGEGVVTTVAVADRKPAPTVSGATLEGGQFQLSALRGKVVVLNFWGSWCAPCRVEGPALQVVAKQEASHGVVFVGVDTRDDDRDAALAFLRDIGSDYLNIDDTSGLVALAFHGTLPPDAVPSTIIIDRDGRVAARIVGPTTEPRLEALLAPLVAEAS